MPSPAIIEALDVIEHAGFCLGSRAIHLLRCSFGHEGGEEALHRSIIPVVASLAPGYRSHCSQLGILEKTHWCTSPPIGMLQYGPRFTLPPDGHHKYIGNQLRSHRIMHQPANDPSQEEIHHRHDVASASSGPEIK